MRAFEVETAVGSLKGQERRDLLEKLEVAGTAAELWAIELERVQTEELRRIGRDRATRGRNLVHVVNNSRFLVLPWVRVHT